MLEGSYLVLKYSDNGCGFDIGASASKGMGLSNITSRIDSMNGVLNITSSEGEGMQALVRINTKQEEPTLKQRKRRRNGKRDKNSIS
jgi:signal transduction histidine kinase